MKSRERLAEALRPLKSFLSHDLYDFPSSCIDPLNNNMKCDGFSQGGSGHFTSF